MFEPSEKSKIKEEAMGKLDPEKSLQEDLESLPFGGLPFSYEGRFSALFEGELDVIEKRVEPIRVNMQRVDRKIAGLRRLPIHHELRRIVRLVSEPEPLNFLRVCRHGHKQEQGEADERRHGFF